MRAFTAAAVQVAPRSEPLSAESIAANIEHSIEWTRRCHEATGAELIVLPETVTTGFTPNCSAEELWDLISEIPSRGDATHTLLAPYAELARELNVILCVGAYERGEDRGVVYNAAALFGRDGSVLGVYRKTHPFCSEAVTGGGWVTAGDTVTVVDTDLARIGMIICFDGDYPELSRIQAVRGAEVILRPTALLRSADIFELTSRARAYDNHVFVIAPNCTGTDPGGVFFFGNSHIVTPVGHIVAKAASHEGWVCARLDPNEALQSLTPGSNVPQIFDHLRDRNLDLIRNHRDDLEAPATTSFPH